MHGVPETKAYMSESTMPAAETNASGFDERNHYEFAFHVLPTVAEGEVAAVFDEIKARIAKVGEITSEEAPERVDLAYPVIKHLEGKNRKFTSSYFGWVRFKMPAEELAGLTEDLSEVSAILRHLLIKLTRQEEAHPFRFHENRKSVKMVEVVDEEGAVLPESPTETEESAEVSEKALDESLDKITEQGEEK
jgi:ribosomal protein S6